MTDKICYNGTLIEPDRLGENLWVALDKLRNENYVYQYIRTEDHKPLQLSVHLERIKKAMIHVHGTKLTDLITLSEKQITADISKLLKTNRYHNKSNLLILMAFPSGDYILECKEQLLYNGYVVWHSRPIAEIFPCEYPFMGYPTAISRLTSQYAREFAEKRGSDIAVIENGTGILTNINDEPLFLVSGTRVLTSPLWEGATDSVMRRHIIAACETIGVEVTEQSLTRDILKNCDEAFTASPQGLVSIKGWGEVRYFNITPGKIINLINRHLID